MGLFLDRRPPRRRGAKLGAAGAALLALALTVLTPGGRDGLAQAGPAEEPFYFRQPAFRVPFQIDPGERRIRQVQPYVSDDQGATWTPLPVVAPEAGGFNYQTPRDGLYWFAVQTIDQDGRRYPANVRQATPGLRVVVDTQAPAVSLRAAQNPDGSVTAEWQVRDDNLKLDTLSLQYRAGTQWVPLVPDRLAAAGSHTWVPRANPPIDVRLEVSDRAGNRGEGTASTSGAGGSTSQGHTSQPLNGRDMQFVNSSEVKLSYDVEGHGQWGISQVEIYRTRDVLTYKQDKVEAVNAKGPYPPITVKLDQEGKHGFVLIAKNRAGGGDPAPKDGTPPQVWVYADWTSPRVHITKVEVGRGPDSAGRLVVDYVVTEENLARQPIHIFYADKPDSTSWVEITPSQGMEITPKQGAESTGRFVWPLQGNVPPTLVVKVEAIDKAKNVGSSISQEVIVDLSQPKIKLLDVQAVPK